MYHRYRLSNGIRLIHRDTSSPVAHCGLFINTGSRDETDDEQGVAHFIEHVIFKGTNKRKAFHILSHMENVGGEINAFTSKEETCIYGSFMHSFYDRWFDIVADIIFHSSFPEKEIKKEKDIVIDEINSYKDSPSEQILDDFDEVVFDGHPLGRNILGTPAHIKKYDRAMIKAFMDRNYVTGEMVICSVGRIDFQKLIRLAETFFGGAYMSIRQQKRYAHTNYLPMQKTITRQNHQAHCVTGNKAYSILHGKKTALYLLNNLLGGPGLTSRLNMAVREKHGFCYHIESIYQPYSDSGIFSIYFGTDPEYVEKTFLLINRELTRLRGQKLGNLQMKRAKNQLCGQVNIAHESALNEMLFIGKQILHYDRTDTLEDINRRIDAVSAEDMLHVANEVFDPGQMSLLTYKPGE
ncbi:MAG: insulinase family protein [Bacteroidia bacterium]|nr:MAG: insulinase family protein [Bacteroidia bacterium]